MEIHNARRLQCLERMGDGVMLLPSAPPRIRSNDVEHEYRQDSDLFYLTGFPEPDAWLLLGARLDGGPFQMVVRPRDPDREVWDGRRAGVEGARTRFGATKSMPSAEVPEALVAALSNAPKVYYRFGRYPEADQAVLTALRRVRALNRHGVVPPYVFVDPGQVLEELRLRKSSDDIALSRRAIDMSVQGHIEAMRVTRPGMHEYEVEAALEATFRRLGSPAPAYASIVGSGPNACILHYRENDRRMADGDLLLVDAGAEWECFSGDITRTYPVNGRFSPAQRAVYTTVLAAQRAAIEKCRPGQSFQAAHDTALRVLCEGLISMGLVSGSADEVIEKESYKAFFMHRTSHWLGLDVHDVGLYRPGGEWRLLEPGMVLTVEPGLYIAPEAPDVPSDFRGIGVRIEDDVLVSAEGPIVLSEGVPTDPDAIEALVGAAYR